jgi:uracil-DNA glycosylase family 4
VPSFGDPDAWLAIVGLAPGRRGANRTGRPFTGDFAGELLFATLSKAGLAGGVYRATRDDGLRLKGTIILNAVKCLPPGNKPEPREVATCGDNYLRPSLAALKSVIVIIALGRIAHEATFRVLGLKPATFAHGAEHELPHGRMLIDSYHCSRQNVNTRRLTPAMFEPVFERAVALRQDA